MRISRARRAALGTIAGLAVLAVVSAPARADTVTDWNAIASSALQGPPADGGAGQGAPSMAHLAMVHGAVYDAVNAIAGGYEPLIAAPEARRWYSQDAAAATAAYRVLVGAVPGLGVTDARLPALAAAYKASLAAIPDGSAKEGGIATGEAAAAAMIAARTGDGRGGPFRFTVGTLPGQWRPFPEGSANDPSAWLKDVTPFVLEDPSEFAGRPPRRLTSLAYAREFAEVKAVGSAGSTVRTPAQTESAQFWGLTNATATWSNILRSVAIEQGGTLADHARLFARAYTNAADALIVTWGDKATHSFWRPITAIREAASDGNRRTEADPAWTSLITAPPYPEHPSGLTTLGAAAAETLEDFYGTDRVAFTAATLPTPAVPVPLTRKYSRFSEAVDDIVDARVWAGIHFRFGDEEAARIGKRVARSGNEDAFRACDDEECCD